MKTTRTQTKNLDTKKYIQKCVLDVIKLVDKHCQKLPASAEEELGPNFPANVLSRAFAGTLISMSQYHPNPKQMLHEAYLMAAMDGKQMLENFNAKKSG